MLQRIWAGIAATWAMIAIFVVLAYGQPARPTTTSSVVMTRTASGQLVPVAGGSGVHAVTSSSGVATYVKTATGQLVPVSNPTSAAAVTRSS